MKKQFLICVAAAVAALIGTTALVFADDAAGTDVVTVNSVGELEQALMDAKENPGTLIVLGQPGQGIQYNLNESFGVPANTTIDLNGQTVNSASSCAFELYGDYSSITDNSNAGGGTIKGGEITVYGYNPNGFVSNISVIGAPYAAVAIIGGGNVLGNIENCYFDGSGSGVTPDPDQIGIRLKYNGECGDIRNNTIVNMKFHGISLNGPSASKDEPNNGCVAGDIEGNIIKNCRGDGVSIYHGSHVGRITGNTLENIGGHDSSPHADFGITVNAGGEHYTYAEEITNNVIKNNTYAAIVVFGRENTKKGIHGIGYCSGDISGNTIIQSGNVAKNIDWGKSGKKPYGCEAAIYIDDNAIVYGDIHDNVIQDCYMDGISVLSSSEVQNIYNNKITKNKEKFGVRASGIAVKSEAQVNGDIYNNKVNNAGYEGFFVNTKSKILGSFHDNTINKTKLNGVFVGAGSNVKTITGNTISNSKQYEVFVGQKGKIMDLSKNKIIHNNKKTIAVISNASGSYIKKIANNQVSGKYSVGFRIKTPKVKVSILSNNMTSKVKSTFMSIENCKSKTITIKQNKIKGNGSGTGIWIRNSKSVIKKNSIKRVSTKISR